MADIFELGYSLDTRQLEKAVNTLDRLADATTKASSASDKYETETKSTSRSVSEFDRITQNAVRIFRQYNREFERGGLRTYQANIRNIQREQRETNRELQNTQNILARSERLASRTQLRVTLREQAAAARETNRELQNTQNILARSERLASRTQLRVTLREQAAAARETNRELDRSNALIERGARLTTTIEGAQERYRQEVQRLTIAYLRSDASQEQYALGMQNLRVQLDNNIRRVKAYQQGLASVGNRTRLARHELLNLSFQLQDIAVGFASGQNPITIFVQQGAQIAGIAGSAGVGLRGMASAVVGLIRPFVRIGALIGSVGFALVSLTNGIKETSNTLTDEYIRSLGIAISETQRLEDALDDLGGRGATFGDIFRGSVDTLIERVPLLIRLIKGIGDSFMELAPFVLDTLDAIVKGIVGFIPAVGNSLNALLFGRNPIEAYFESFRETSSNITRTYDSFIENISRATRNRLAPAIEGVLAESLARVERMVLTPLERIEQRFDEAVSVVQPRLQALQQQIDLGIGLTEKETTEYTRLSNVLARLAARRQEEIDQLTTSNRRSVDRTSVLEKITRNLELQIQQTTALTGAQADEADLQVIVNRLREKSITLTAQEREGLLLLIRTNREQAEASAAAAKEAEEQQQRIDQITNAYTQLQQTLETPVQRAQRVHREQLQVLNEAAELNINGLTRQSEAYNNLKNAIDDVLITSLNVGDSDLFTDLQNALQEGLDSFNDTLQEFNESIIGDNPFTALLEAQEDLRRALSQPLPDDAVASLQTSLRIVQRQIKDVQLGLTIEGIEGFRSLASEGSDAYKALTIAAEALNVTRAIGAVLNQLESGDPYTAFARAGAAAAAVASLGVAIGSFSGSGGSNLAEIQAAQGTGTILGDPTAQSESITNAVEATAEATEAIVGINSQMLRALNNLSEAIANTSTVISRNLDLRSLNQAGGGGISNLGALGGLAGGAIGGLAAGGAALLAAEATTLAAAGSAALLQGFTGTIATGVIGLSLSNPYTIAASLIGAAIGLQVGEELAAALEGTFIESLANSLTNALDAITFGGFSDVTSAIFGGDTRVTDFGIQIHNQFVGQLLEGAMTAFRGQAISSVSLFQQLEEEGGIFGGGGAPLLTNTNRPELAAPQAVTDQIVLIFRNMADAIVTGAEILGMSAEQARQDILQARLEDIQISLRDLSPEEQTQQINRVLSGVFDDLVGQVLGESLSSFQRAGEGLAETMSRVVNNVSFFSSALPRLGFSLQDIVDVTNESAAEVATTLADLSGSFEDFVAAQNAFIDNFLTDAEQFSILQDDILRVFQNLGQELPATREGFRQLVEGLQITNDESAETFVSLLKVSTLADEYYSALEEQEENRLNFVRTTVNDAFNALKDSVQAQKDAITVIYQEQQEVLNEAIRNSTTRISELEKVSTSLSSTLTTLIQNFTGSNATLRNNAQAEIRQALANARQGILPTEGQLDEALAVVAQPSEQLFGSFEEYARDFFRTANDIRALNTLTDDALSVEERTLDNLQNQLALLEQNYNDEIARLDQIITDAQEQINVLNGINTSVLSVADAIGALQGVIEAQRQVQGSITGGVGNAPATAEEQIEQIYREVLRREADAGGLAYWTALLESGAQTLEAIRAGIEESPEAQALGNVPATTITNTTNSRQADQIAQMRRDNQQSNEEQTNILRSIATESKRSRQINEDWNLDGLPETRNVGA